ncbi:MULTISPECIES: FAD-dependent oxidoreductase [unclassified Achromobacter]|uniref:FAD-dependent oxidoreductase n=1 Tax=unclassified Achromobacter TaxID=2626865 RepID=UPI000B51C4B6|nr:MULTISPECIES: FAD-dependent oxidoreductase [unclassified Achromobacter]OWT75476.1 amine oxidase [Achromobacter sp. HZ28]OWT76136.1 amine oxidase [Achromobacter sp. HZ34]
MRRRTFLLGSAVGAAALGTAARLTIRETVPTVAYPGMREGHGLRDGAALPAPSGEQRAAVAVLGAGVAGLSCAWQLARRGYRDFVVLAGPEFGGNSSGGGAGDLAYPRGAHYLPLPSRASTHVREMLAEFGVILDGAQTERPYMDEAVIVHGLDERLLRDGHWGDSLVPPGATPAEQAQHDAFFRYVDGLRDAVGKDGRKLFCIPIALSSQDAEWRALDRLTFKQWLVDKGYTSPALHWYLNYCCRDDYGAPHDRVSAWAGLHYFCSRDGHASNAPDGAVLTWPNGLARMVAYLRASITRHLGHEDWLVPGTAMRVEEQGQGVEVLVADGFETAPGPVTRTLRADRVVCAMPLFVAAHVVRGMAGYGYDHAVHQSPHAPWLVSNFTLEGFPPELDGAPLAWDNVVYNGPGLDRPGLGYVVSTHQLIRVAPPSRTVFTAYEAVSVDSPEQARRWLARADARELRDHVAVDLLTAYDDALWRHASRLDITVRGHAMATPAPGYLGNAGLAALREVDGRVLFAHADLSGYSVFEEASWWGVSAASRILGEA